MSMFDYIEARSLGQKEYRACVSGGRYPFLQVLDDVLSFTETQREEPLGLVDIPVSHIVGTKTAGRTNAFAANFMPLLSEHSEFAGKWARLSDAHLEEGIRDPVVAYEYMNRFYISEGNKRVSVMKFFGAATIPGTVKRLVPKPQDTDESRLYFAFLDFYKLTKVNYIWFSQPEKFKALLNMTGGSAHVWEDEERSDFLAAYFRFRKTFKELGGDRIYGTTGDSFLAFLKIYDIKKINSADNAKLRERIHQSWSELAASSVPEPIALELDPKETNAQPSILSKILPAKKTLSVLFVYERSPETSSWSHAHDEGRKTAEEYFEGKITTRFAENVSPADFGGVISEELKSSGADVVFTTSPKLLPPCLKASVKYPDVKFLNCSVYSPHPTIRSYYGRMYEIKFLAGLIAGTMTQTHKIGYLADYPIYGTPAAVNAFAKGARMTDPYAQVILRWNSRINAGGNVWNELVDQGVDMIAGLDSWSPVDIWRAHGLYKLDGSVGKQIFKWQMNWGQFYIRIMQEILDGAWKNAPDKENPKAVNYWWGLSADVFDTEFTPDIPEDTLQLASLLTNDVISRKIALFDRSVLSPEDVIKMDSFSENVIGSVPDISELTEDAKELIKIQGIFPEFREDSI